MVREDLPSEVTKLFDFDLIWLTLVEVGQALLIDLGGDGGGGPKDVLESGTTNTFTHYTFILMRQKIRTLCCFLNDI